MRAPPPVVVQCQFGPLWRLGLSLSLGAAAAVLVFRWGLQESPLGEPVPFGLHLLCVGIGLFIATVSWRLFAAGSAELRWTGRSWSLAGMPVNGVIVQLDFGRWMLLQCHCAQRGQRWQAVHESNNRPHWAAWRAAVYCAGRGNPPALES